jgi:MoaA/NifB/PqqE/SkfB family radical SAM enzyme
VHINSQGWVEPCPFAHYAAHCVKDTALEEALRSPFLAYIRSRPELRSRPDTGCALFEHWNAISEGIAGHGVRSTEMETASDGREPVKAA